MSGKWVKKLFGGGSCGNFAFTFDLLLLIIKISFIVNMALLNNQSSKGIDAAGAPCEV